MVFLDGNSQQFNSMQPQAIFFWSIRDRHDTRAIGERTQGHAGPGPVAAGADEKLVVDYAASALARLIASEAIKIVGMPQIDNNLRGMVRDFPAIWRATGCQSSR